MLSRVTDLLTLVANIVVADCSNFPCPNCRAIVLGVIRDMNAASFGAVVIENIDVDRPAIVGCIESLEGRQLASVDWGCNPAAVHRSLGQPSFRLLPRYC